MQEPNVGTDVVSRHSLEATDIQFYECWCKSAQGLDADRLPKLLIRLAVKGSLLDAYSHGNGRAERLLPHRGPHAPP